LHNLIQFLDNYVVEDHESVNFNIYNFNIRY